LTIGWNWFLTMHYICFYVIALRLVKIKYFRFSDIFLTCNRNLFVFVSVFAKLLMPVCGVWKFASVLYFVFVREWNLSVVMSGLSHWKYDFRHVHCSAVQSCTVPLLSSLGLCETCPMTVVRCNNFVGLVTDFWWSSRIELN
jgi:hypothetical protein